MSENKSDELEVVEAEKVCITISGKKCTKGQAIGYCWSDLHKGFLTKQLMEQHECLKKQCPGFQKFPEAPYWVQKEKNRRKKLIAKAKKKEIEERKELYLKKIRELTIEDKDFYAVSIEKENGVFIVRFIKFKSIDYKEYIKMFSINCNDARFYLKEIKTNIPQKLKIIETVGIAKTFEEKEIV